MTAHGLDEGDRQALLSAYGHKVNEKMVRNCPPGTLVFNDVEHMNVRPYHKIGKIRAKYVYIRSISMESFKGNFSRSIEISEKK